MLDNLYLMRKEAERMNQKKTGEEINDGKLRSEGTAMRLGRKREVDE